jgi:2-methylaconitate cis-trans-isomerase PrpF
MYDTEAVRCAVYRGGTSRGILFLENDLPADETVRAQVLLSIFGSPDPRQIDGLGGATSPTSKAMIVGPAGRPDADVQMLFAQVSIRTSLVDLGGSCGNLTAAVGPFAVDRGLVRATEPLTRVRIYSVNTNKIVNALVPTARGRAVSTGDYTVPGVPGTGARIDLEYVDPAGAFSGRLLPTGSPRDTVELDDHRRFTVSIVDAANPVIFCDARELGLSGTELPAELEGRTDVMATLEAIRSAVAERIGVVSDRRAATATSPGLPKIGFVSPPARYTTLDGATLGVADVDIVGRLLSMQTAHRAYMGTGAVCTGAAAMIEGTLVNEFVAAAARRQGTVRIGHPYGVMDVKVAAAADNGHVSIRSATIGRTARRIMEGHAFVPRDRFGKPGSQLS